MITQEEAGRLWDSVCPALGKHFLSFPSANNIFVVVMVTLYSKKEVQFEADSKRVLL